MMTILNSPMVIIQLLLLWYVILIAFEMMIVMWQVIISRRFRDILLSISLLAASHLVYLILRAAEQYRDKGRVFAVWMEDAYHLPLILLLIVTLVVTVLDIMVVIGGIKWRNDHISRTSVYESFQKLPIGICCYEDGGMTRLVNKKMNEIARELTGMGIVNGECFAEQLRGAAAGAGKVMLEEDDELGSGIFHDNKIVAITPTRIVYSFSLTDIPFRNTILHEILAIDVTQEYQNLRELHKDKKRMQEINKRLRAYSRDVVDVNIEKEILDAKIKIHDELGHALIVSERYLRTGDGDRDGILALWHKNISLLKEERGEDISEDYDTMFYIAKCAGVDIRVDGDLPKKPQERKRIVVTAISECLTNVCRHTQGNSMEIQTGETNDRELVLIFTNNGEAPAQEIREGGGLGNLRKMVEDAGGTMRIQSFPEFRLMLTIPALEVENG